MSSRSRFAKAQVRSHARFIARRDRIRANQANTGDFDWAILGAAQFMVSCDPERYARRWNENHPDPVPFAHGYHRKHKARR